MEYKVLVVGDTNCGKTCLIDRITSDIFKKDTNPTTCVQNSFVNLTYENQSIKIQFTDVAGSFSYRTIIPSYYNNAKIVLLVFSLDDKESFTNINDWVESVSSKLNITDKSQADFVPLILVGTKSDLERAVEVDEAEQKSKDIGSACYIEVSSLNGNNFDRLKNSIAAELIKKKVVQPIEPVVIKKEPQVEKDKKCC